MTSLITRILLIPEKYHTYLQFIVISPSKKHNTNLIKNLYLTIDLFSKLH
jgi:hypothetical protein